MCGIAGIYKLHRDACVEAAAIARMQQAMAHRGPDDAGAYTSADSRLRFAHTRLSIIDLSEAAHQPMSNHDKTIWLAYNGEIYNYQQLQAELKQGGCTFASNSDTEVIICGYERWGIDGLLSRLRGMFAFALYDTRAAEPRLILARDRFGIKPLYYYRNSELLIFSSEVKAMLKAGVVAFERDRKADLLFLMFGHIPAPYTTIKDIFSLPAGSYMFIESNVCNLVQYYDLKQSFFRPKVRDTQDTYDRLLSVLNETLKLHLISDAPLGVFLSGGIDSSALVALASNLRTAPLATLSIIFDEEAYSEQPYQEVISKRYRTDHRQVKVTEKDFYGEIDNIFEAMDQPTVDGVNTYFVSQAAKKVGLKAVLSGLGADEVFCGYESFKKIGTLNKIFKLPKPLRALFSLARIFNDRWAKLTYLKDNDSLSRYLTLRALFTPQDAATILDIPEKEAREVLEDFRRTAYDLRPTTYDLLSTTLHPIDWLSYMELTFYLQNQLLKDTDFMSMHHSVETRVPYLDHALVEYVVSVDSALKLDSRIPKALLVKSLKDLLPKEIVFRKKQGFTFPFDVWIRHKGKERLSEAVEAGDLNKKYAEMLWRKFQQGGVHWSRIWSLIVMAKHRTNENLIFSN